MVGRLLRGLLGLVTLVLALAPAIAGLLIVLPPFGDTAGWSVSLVLTEWSLLLVPPAIVGLLLAAFSRWAGPRRTAALGLIMSLLALILAAVPTVRGVGALRVHGVGFDVLDYLSGSSADSALRPAETTVYARPEGVPLRLDVWTPQDGTAAATREDRPAVIRVHGGSWTEGRRSELPRWDTWLASRGYVVFDIDYRLSRPGAPTWRRAPGDVKCAVAWVRANATRYGVDADRLVLMGDSAGGHLALLAANAGPELPSACPDLGGHGRAPVEAVIAMYAPTVLADAYRAPRPWWYDPTLWRTGQRWLRTYLGGSPEQVPEAYRASEPFRHVDRDSPRTLLVHGGSDLLVPVDDSRRMARALSSAGAENTLVEIGYADHAFDVNWGGFGAQIARFHITRFLREGPT